MSDSESEQHKFNSGPTTYITGGTHIATKHLKLVQINRGAWEMPVCVQAIDGQADDADGPVIVHQPRNRLLNKLQTRLQHGEKELIWLTGPARAGKSTLLRQLRDRLQPSDSGGTHWHPTLVKFFASDAATTPYNDLITTIVYQLQQQGVLAHPVVDGERVYALSLEQQVKHWIVEPLRKKALAQRVVILIDSLESLATSTTERAAAFTALRSLVATSPRGMSIRVLVTSRHRQPPFPANHEWTPDRQFMCPVTILNITHKAEAEVTAFYQAHLPVPLAKRPRTLELLVQFTLGNFGLASHLVSHVLDEPDAWSFPTTSQEARQGFGFRGLDEAYGEAFKQMPRAEVPAVERFIAHALSSPALVFSELVSNAQVDPNKILTNLDHLQGIVHFETSSEAIRFAHFHTLYAFLSDHTRCHSRIVIPPDLPTHRYLDRINTLEIRDAAPNVEPHTATIDDTPTARTSGTQPEPPKTKTTYVEGQSESRTPDIHKALDLVLPQEMSVLRRNHMTAGLSHHAVILLESSESMPSHPGEPQERERPRIHVGDIGSFSSLGALDVKFNTLLDHQQNKDAGFTCPRGFQPPRGISTCWKRHFPPDIQGENGVVRRCYGSASHIGEKSYGEYEWSLPKDVVCNAVDEQTSGGSILLHNGHTKSSLKSKDLTALDNYLSKNAHLWDWDDPLLQNQPVICVTSALYTDIWTSITFHGKSSNPLVAKMTEDTVLRGFYRWSNWATGFEVETYNCPVENKKTVPPPGNPKGMRTCIAINFIIVQPPPRTVKKQFGWSFSFRSLSSNRSQKLPSNRSFISEPADSDDKEKKKRASFFGYFGIKPTSSPLLIENGPSPM